MRTRRRMKPLDRNAAAGLPRPSPGAAEDVGVPEPRPVWTRLLLLAVFLGGIALFFAVGGDEWLRFETIREHRDELLAYTREHYWTMLAASFLVYVATVALSIPGASLLSLAAGFLFGRWVGTLLIVLAATVGATLVFLAARHLFAGWAARLVGTRVGRLAEGFGRDALSYLLFLRLVPVFPFWVSNLLPALTPVPTRTYVLGTAIGILPGSFVFANLGGSLGRIESPRELLSTEVLVAFSLLGMLALIPVFIRKVRSSQPGGIR